MIWTDALPYFPKRELADSRTGDVILDVRFAAALPELRRAWGGPLSPTSVCRTPATNAAVGGHPRSLHLTENPVHTSAKGCMAADLGWRAWRAADQERLYRLALSLGWACGLHAGFLHVDRRGDIGLPVVTFHYPSWDHRFPNAT